MALYGQGHTLPGSPNSTPLTPVPVPAWHGISKLSSLHRPTLGHPPLHRPTLHHPPLHRPTLHHPPLHRPTLGHPPLHRPPKYRLLHRHHHHPLHPRLIHCHLLHPHLLEYRSFRRCPLQASPLSNLLSYPSSCPSTTPPSHT